MSSTNVTKGEHYNLRWNNYFNNLVQVFSDLQHKEQLVDVTLECEGQQIKAHKIILAACSDFFMNLFQNLEVRHPMVIFKEIQLTNLKQILQFIYHGEVKVLDSDLEGVLNLGEKFQIKGLSSVKLNHKVSPRGEDVCEETVNYRIVTLHKSHTSSSQTTEANTMEKLNINKLKDTNPTNIYEREPVQKKQKIDSLVKDSLSTEQLHSKLEENSFKPSSPPSPSNVPSHQINKQNNILNSSENKSDNSSQKTHQQYINKHVIDKKISEKQHSIVQQTLLSETSSDISEKPVNAFILFSKEWRKKLKVEYPLEDFKTISVRLGNLWKSLTSETRESYYVAARQAQLCSEKSQSEL